MNRQAMAGMILVAALAGPAVAQTPSNPLGASASRPVGLEVDLLRALQLNPSTASYGFSTERRGSKIALRGRVGTKIVHDVAIRTALMLDVPVIDEIVIDTLAVHQAANPGAGQGGPGMGYGMAGTYGGYGGAGPSAGLGGYPGATSLYGNLPYTYPQPLFGRLDEPFFGYEPPALGFPPWWGAMTAARVGVANGPQAANAPPQQQAVDPSAAPANLTVDPQASNLPAGTIDLAIDGRGVATLRGDVPTFGERITLGQKVAQAPGITQVINLLNVKAGLVAANAGPALSDKPPPLPVPADVPSNGAKPVPSAVVDGPPIVLEADPVGQRASKALASRAGLGAGSSAKVKVKEGVATLSGTVPSVYEAMLAYRAVQRTPGVREVDDRLEFVVPDGNTPNPLAEKGRPEDVEPYLEAQIRRQVGDLAHLDRVRAQGADLELKGTLEREDDRPRFDAILRSMPILRGFRITADLPAESR